MTYENKRVSNVSIISKYKETNISGIQNFALIYEGTKLTGCKSTFQFHNTYPEGIKLKSDINGRLSEVSSGSYFTTYSYDNNNEINKAFSTNWMQNSYLKYDSTKNLIEVKTDAMETYSYTYSKILNPFSHIEKRVLILLAFVKPKLGIYSHCNTSSRNVPKSYTISFRDALNASYVFLTRVNKIGQITECTITRNYVVQEEFRFYY